MGRCNRTIRCYLSYSVVCNGIWYTCYSEISKMEGRLADIQMKILWISFETIKHKDRSPILKWTNGICYHCYLQNLVYAQRFSSFYPPPPHTKKKKKKKKRKKLVRKRGISVWLGTLGASFWKRRKLIWVPQYFEMRTISCLKFQIANNKWTSILW
jgi:hypothetical protein